jgi:peroxiredoxin
VQLQADYQKLQDVGINVASISYDSEETVKAFADEHGISFPMLADLGSSVIEKFDLLNPVPQWGVEDGLDDPELAKAFRTYVSVTGANSLFVGIAFPGTFLLDSSGVVQERHFEEAYEERNTVSSILLRLGEDIEPVAATIVSTVQLDLTTYSSNQTIVAGNRFALVMDIQPKPGMHVYAPGADKYQVVGLTLDSNPHIRVLPMQYPESESYYFEPFDETVPVYLQAIKLLQEVVLGGDRESQRALSGQDSLTISGSFEYQACDEAICYLPTSIPVSWTLQLGDLVSSRPGRDN